MSSTTPGSDPDRPREEPDTDPAQGDTGSFEDSAATVASEPTGAPDAAAPAEPTEPAEPEPAAPVESAAPEPRLEPAEAVGLAEAPDATARLDAAVERANAAPATSDLDDTDAPGEATPEPVPADSVRRETYVPAATVVAGTAAGAATLAPEPEPYVAPVPQTIYVQAPTPPRSRGNRGFGVLVALIGAVLFALIYAGVAYLLLLGRGDAGLAANVLTQFLLQPVYWVPIVVFFLGFALLAAIVNRGPWWHYAVFGLLVAVLVYFSYIGGSLLTVQAWTLSVDEAADFVNQRWLDPFAIAAFIIAREIPIWLGGWIAARGRTVTERNREAIEAYDREIAAGPQPMRY